MNELEDLKNILDNHRKKNQNNKRKKFPDIFWTKAIDLAKRTSPKDVASSLGISLPNLNKKMIQKKNKKKAIEKFIEIPVAPKMPKETKKKSIIIDLPHNITLRIEI